MILFATLLRYAGFVAEVFLLVLLLRGPFRSFQILFWYCLVQLISTWVEAYTQYVFGSRSSAFRIAYWSFEIIIDLLLFVLVATLTYRVMAGSPYKHKVGRLLLMVAAAMILLPLGVYSGRPLFSNAWFNGVSQFLNFGAALMAFALWAAVVGTRTRDLQLLAFAAGLGLAVTGSAISFGLRQLTSPVGTARSLANLFGPLTFLASNLIWCWAFRKKRPAVPATSSQAPAD